MKTVLAVMIFVAAATLASAQGNPTGAIRGAVADATGLPLPGVTVTVSSPALQGTRDVVTSAAGEFLIPFLPPGDYTVTFELQGFATQKQTIGVAMAETQPMKITLALPTVSETVTVQGSLSTEVLKAGTIAETYSARKIDLIPIGRTLEQAVLLAPGVNNGGPGGNIVMAGALSFEGLYLINGVNVNENLRGQPRQLYVEDAIQETKVSTGNISAEYGRFNGGVVSMITKSGGNNFSGSFRDSLTNDAWRALRTPDDTKMDQVVPTYEGTFGGPIKRDKLWFFADGRYTNNQRQITLPYTLLNYPWAQSDKRYEGKGTYALTQNHTVKGSYTTKKIWTTNNSSNSPMDLASLYNNGTTDGLRVFNYSGVLSSKVFLEGQFSRKTMATDDTGSQFTDLVQGTLMFDRSRGNTRFNSPTFCAVCGSGWHEERNNWDFFVKMGYFLSTSRMGSHNLVFGVDNFKESRKVDNYQGGSGYRVYVTKTYIGNDAARTIYPVMDGSSYIQYTPLVEHAVGSDIRTYSGFVNDQWRFGNRLTFNLGARFDFNRSKDQGGVPVLRDQQWSPRLGVSYDIKGDGKWIANAGFARYVMGVNGAVVDQGSKGGRTASYSWTYAGPKFNTTCTPPNCLVAADILPQVFAWFGTVGGPMPPNYVISNTKFRSAPSIPGVTTHVSDQTIAPSSDEITLGLARELGRTGAIRVDYTHRRYHDMYGSYTDMTTGKVTDPTGRTYDAEIVKNTPDATRWYDGVTLSLNSRVTSLFTVGANYTLSYSKGNNDGENVGSGPIMASINVFPEYRQQAWNWPEGYMMNDQRHKMRVYANYVLPVNPAFGSFTVGAVQRVSSGLPYDIAFSVDPRPYVTNPGYITPPSTVTYYIDGRGALRTDTIYNTDVSLVWTRKVRGNVEVFVRALAYNIFNNLGVLAVDNTVNSNASPGAYKAADLPAFNPFTTQPVAGTNYKYASTFGLPTGPGDYQDSRSFQFSFGIRF